MIGIGVFEFLFECLDLLIDLSKLVLACLFHFTLQVDELLLLFLELIG